MVQKSDVLVENFGPGAVDRMGFTWDRLQELNPRLVYASIKGFGEGPYTHLQGVRGGRPGDGRLDDAPPVSRTGRRWPPARRSATRAPACTPSPASSPRSCSASSTGRGQRVTVAMQHAVLNLCRVKLRDQQRLDARPARGVPERAVRRRGAALGQRVRRRPARLGRQVRARRPERLHLRDRAAARLGPDREADRPARARRRPRVEHAGGAAAEARQDVPAHRGVVDRRSTSGRCSRELNAHNIPCGPILSTKELIEDASLADNDMVVTVDHPERGAFKTVGCPIKLSDSPVKVEHLAAARRAQRGRVRAASWAWTRERLAELKTNGVI